MARNYKRDRLGRFARKAGGGARPPAKRSGRRPLVVGSNSVLAGYSRGKARRVDARKARSAAISGKLAPVNARINAVRSTKGYKRTAKTARVIATYGPTAVEVGGFLIGAASVAGLNQTYKRARYARSDNRGISAVAHVVRAQRPNRNGVYNITTIGGRKVG
jgi:hypothetical protein